MQICFDRTTGYGCRHENADGESRCAKCGKALQYAVRLYDRGAVVSGWTVQGLLGYGGFGAVYEAVNGKGERAALKESFHVEMLQVFAKEFRVLQRLSHPNLPAYRELFERDGKGFLVMELVPGQTLQDVAARRGTLPETVVLGYAGQLLDALAFLHSQRSPVVHRDIKPANIRLTPEGVIKLVDFGLMKEGTENSSIHAATPDYAPPEQLLPGLHTSPASDLFSLGATLYRLLSGQAPANAQTRLVARSAQRPDPLVPLRQIRPDVSPRVSDALDRAMALAPDDRFPDAAAFRAALFGAEGLVDCPMCGRSNRTTDTFTCARCGRKGLCLGHQDPKTFLCAACQGETRPAAGGPVRARSGDTLHVRGGDTRMQGEETLPFWSGETEAATPARSPVPGKLMPPSGKAAEGSVCPAETGGRPNQVLTWTLAAVAAVALGLFLLTRGSGGVPSPEPRPVFPPAVAPPADAAGNVPLEATAPAAAQAAEPARNVQYGHYVDNGDGTLTDTKSGLMWTKTDSRRATGRGKNWDESRAWVDALTTGGHTDWRMPSIAEYKSIYDNRFKRKDCTGDACLKLCPLFDEGGAFWLWSREEASPGVFRVIGLDDSHVLELHSGYEDNVLGVRAVRSPGR